MALISDEGKNIQKGSNNVNNACKNNLVEKLNSDSILHKTNSQEGQSRSRCYYGVQKYRCKLSEVPISRPINGQDKCSPGNPAFLPIEKLKLHYVAHYMLRGTWSDIVPEEVDEGRVEAYKCNICQKRFKNYYEKKEFPARGSVICHIATDHGRLTDAMKNDGKVNMQSELDLLSKMINGRSNSSNDVEGNCEEKELVTAVESILWKNDQKHLVSDSNRVSNVVDKEKDSTNIAKYELPKTPSSLPNSSTEIRSETTSANLKTGIQPKAFYSKESRSLVIECPHCNEFAGNSDSASLRLHIFHHYKEHWMSRVESLEQGPDNRYFCDVCPKRKSVTGATPEGAKLAAVCHFSIQHGELRNVLKEDTSLTENFISDLYWDIDHPNEKSRNCSYYISQTSFVKTVKPTASNTSKKESKRFTLKKSKIYSKNNKRKCNYSSEETEEEDTCSSDSSNESMDEERSISDASESENTRGKIIGKMRDNFRQNSHKDVSKTKKKSRLNEEIAGMPNQNYIRKRKKLKISLEDLENDDSSSDGEWKDKKFVKRKGRKLSRLNGNNFRESSLILSETEPKTRVLPRRAVTLNKKTVIDSGEVNSELESENNE